MSAAGLVGLAYLGLLGTAALWDLARLRIPNALCLAIVALWPAAALLGPLPGAWHGHLLTAALVLLLGLPLFQLRVMGGGDVKLLAATALWAGPAGIADHLAVTAIGGALLALLLLAARALLARLGVRRLPASLQPGAGIPYAVPIALAAALLLPAR